MRQWARGARAPNAACTQERWFAHAADGDFESPFVVRHPSWERALSTVYHRVQEGAVRWRSSDHPLGFTRARASVGGLCGGKVRRVSGFNSEKAEVVLLDRLGTVPQSVGTGPQSVGTGPGFAVAVRGEAPEAFVAELDETYDGKRESDDFTGDERLRLTMCGWIYEDGNLRVRIQRNGCLRGVWQRTKGAWRRILWNGLVATDTGIGRKNLFGGRGARDCKQSEEIDAEMRFWKASDGTLHLTFQGDLRAYGVGGKMKVPIWFRTRYAFKGDRTFGFESAIAVERTFEPEEGELALRLRFDRTVVDPSAYLSDVTTYGAAAEARPDRSRHAHDFHWLSGDIPFAPPKKTWNGVRFRFDIPEPSE